MADIFVAEQSAPTTPSAGNAVIWVDTSGVLCWKDDAGKSYGTSGNASVATQSGFASDTYVTNSDVLVPTFGVQAETVFIWRFTVSKTAAGTAQPVYNIRIGASRTTADTARVTMTAPAQTAIADVGTLNIMATVRTVGAAGVIQAAAWWDHRGTAASSSGGTGFANDGTGHIEATSAGFDNSALGGLNIGVSINGGASAAWTMTQAVVQARW